MSDITVDEVKKELEKLKTEKTYKTYLSQGAINPIGVPTLSMKPLARKIMHNQELALELYDSGIYDLMYLAGMIVDPEKMNEEIFNDWINKAYIPMISDHIVSVSLAECCFALKLASEWILNKKDLIRSAAYNCYAWVVGVKSDNELDYNDLKTKLEIIENNYIIEETNTKKAMLNYVYSIGVSYKDLYQEALKLSLKLDNKTAHNLEIAFNKNRIGFKRKKVRC